MDTIAASEGLHHPEVPVPHEERHAARVEVIAHQHGGVLAEARVGGRPAPPERRLVDHVVVDQASPCAGAPRCSRAAPPARRVGPERRAEQAPGLGRSALPARERDVLAEIPDELDRRVGQLPIDLRLAGAQRSPTASKEPLPEGRLPRRCSRDAPRDRRTGPHRHRQRRVTGSGKDERRGNSAFGSFWSVRSFQPSTTPGTPWASWAAGMPEEHAVRPPAGRRCRDSTVSAAPAGRLVAVCTSQSGLRAARMSRSASWRNRCAIAGGSGRRSRRDHRHAGAGRQSEGRASGIATSGRPGSAICSVSEHLRDRVALAADLEEEHVFGACAELGHLDLRPGRAAGRRPDRDVEPSTAAESARGSGTTRGSAFDTSA